MPSAFLCGHPARGRHRAGIRDRSACMPPPGPLPHPGLLPSVALRSRAPRRGLRHPCLREFSPASCRRGRFRALRYGWHRATAGDLSPTSVSACLPAATSAAPVRRASMPEAGDVILPSRSAAPPPRFPSVVRRGVPGGRADRSPAWRASCPKCGGIHAAGGRAISCQSLDKAALSV